MAPVIVNHPLTVHRIVKVRGVEMQSLMSVVFAVVITLVVQIVLTFQTVLLIMMYVVSVMLIVLMTVNRIVLEHGVEIL